VAHWQSTILKLWNSMLTTLKDFILQLRWSLKRRFEGDLFSLGGKPNS
jgi:hypothetical protein